MGSNENKKICFWNIWPLKQLMHWLQWLKSAKNKIHYISGPFFIYEFEIKLKLITYDVLAYLRSFALFNKTFAFSVLLNNEWNIVIEESQFSLLWFSFDSKNVQVPCHVCFWWLQIDRVTLKIIAIKKWQKAKFCSLTNNPKRKLFLEQFYY